MNKAKRISITEKPELIDDPTKRKGELNKIMEDLHKLPELSTNLKSKLDQIEKNLLKETNHDKEISRTDTVECIKRHFDLIIKEFSILNQKGSNVKEKLYHLTYNASILIFDYLHRMRRYNYSINGLRYLYWIISMIEADIILSSVKYLKWRVKLYLELALCYEDHAGYKAAFKVINQATNKVMELRAIEEQGGVCPENIKVIFVESLRVLKIFDMKYGFLSGIYQVDLWKKKLEENFPGLNDRPNKIISAINSFCSYSKYSSVVFHDGLKSTAKPQAVLYFYDLIKSDLSAIRSGITEYIDKRKREVDKKERIKENTKDYKAVLDEHKEKDVKMNKVWRASAKSFPIEIHGDILKAAFDCKMWKEFIELLETLKLRIMHRTVEVPYISEIDIQVSSSPNANIPNKYERLKIDLNVNSFYRDLKKLREKGKVIGLNAGVNNSFIDDPSKAKQSQSANAGKKKAVGIDEVSGGKNFIQINPNDKIEGIDHTYIYLLLRKSSNPSKAVISTRIVVSNDYKISSCIEADEKAFAIPLKTFNENLYEEEENSYDNISHKIKSENNRLIPYLVYKKTTNSLQNEEEKLSALVDIFPLVSNSSYADSPINFKKIESELTIEKTQKLPSGKSNQNSSHFYVNICQKSDEVFYIVKRESEILKMLYELETTFVEMNTTDFRNFSQSDKFLSLNFNIEKLEMTASLLNQSITGPLGNFFLSERRNFVYDICVLLWKKYLKEFLIRVDYFYSIEAELEDAEKFELSEKILKLQKFIFPSLFNIHRVLSFIDDTDPIMFAFLTRRLADYCEKTENISIGVDIVKKTLDYIRAHKEEQNLFGRNNKENKHTFTSFTCDNIKISNLNKTVCSKYEEYVKELNLKRRRNSRRESNSNALLTHDEEVEEDFEYCHLEKDYEDRMSTKFKKNIEKSNIDIEEVDDRARVRLLLTENENTLNCLYVDLLVKYYRLYLKLGFNESSEDRRNVEKSSQDMVGDTDKLNTDLRSHSTTKLIERDNLYPTNLDNTRANINKMKIADRTLKKLDIVKGPTASSVKTNLETLKGSLQEAGKLEPDKPSLYRHEKTMLGFISDNIYMNTLFHMTLATFRSNKMDKKFLLNQSAKYLNQCFDEEDSREKYYEDNFMQIMSLNRLNKNKDHNAATFYPFSLLHNDIMIDLCDKIPEPILIHKTEQTATFVFPIVKIKNEALNGFYKVTNRIALYGQQSTGSNIVSLNNNKLFGTGTLTSVLDYITVRNLKQNEKYIYAYAGYDTDELIINGVGKTSKEVPSYFPLPKFMIAYHLAKLAYEYNQYEISKDIAKIVFNYYTEKSELKDLSLDNKSDCLFFYKLRYNSVKLTCFLELEGVAYSFLYYAKCVLLLKPFDHDHANCDGVYNSVNVLNKQKNLLKNLNVLMLGLEIAVYIRHFSLIKLIVNEAYASLGVLLKQKNLHRTALQLLIRLNIAANIIPNELWDISIRNISSCISYQVLLFSLNNGENEFYRKIISQENYLNKKKFYLFKYKLMKKSDSDGKKVKFALPQEGKGLSNKLVNDIEENKFIEVDAVLLKDIEKETGELDEFLMYTGEYSELMRTRIYSYIQNLERFCTNFAKIPEINSEFEKRKKELIELVDVWEGFKNEGAKYLQKFVVAQRETNEKYYEFASKMLKKLIENNYIYIPNTLAVLQSNQSKFLSGQSNQNSTVYTATINEIIRISEDIATKESDIAFIANIFLQKMNYLTNDIIYSMKKRIREFLDRIEFEIKEQNEKLKKETKRNLKETDEDDLNFENINLNNVKTQGSTNNLDLDLVSLNINLEKIRTDIEEKCFGSQVENEKSIPYGSFTINEVFLIKEKFFWLGDLIFNKATVLYLEYLQNHKSLQNFSFNNFLNEFKLVDLNKIQTFAEESLEAALNINNTPKINNINNTNNDHTKLTEYRNITPNNSTLEKNIDMRYKRLSKIFEKLSLSSLFLNEVKSWNSFDNLLYMAYNLLLYDMMLPMDALNENICCYLNLIAETAIRRLEVIRHGEAGYKPTDYAKEINSLKTRLQDKGVRTGTNFRLMKNFDMNSSFSLGFSNETANTIEDDKLVEEFASKINFDAYAEFILFCIQCTYYAGKWNVLSDLIQKFNEITLESFAEFTLPFLIEAQTKIYNKAFENLKDKKTEIEHKVAAFEAWKKSRKKNKRQQMITGEIPQEQKDFEKDHSIISKELYILDSISSLFKSDKEKSEKQYQSLVNDTNNCNKALNNCRKQFERYKIETLALSGENYPENSEVLQKKKKSQQALATDIISAYKKTILILKKRQENYLLIQALYEMSIVYHSQHDIKSAEIYLNESLDTVFQKLYIVKDFRSLFDTVKSLPEKYGIRELFYAVNILHKLSKYCYVVNLHMQRECAVMSADIILQVLSCYLPNPSGALNYSLYRLNEINKNLNVFKSSENVRAEDLLSSLMDIGEILLQLGEYERSLPLLALAEHLACDITKNLNFLHNLRVMRIICLAHLGLISEAVQIYYKIVKKYDLPCFILNSLQAEKTNGKFASLTKEFKFYNNYSPENQKNVDAINSFCKLQIDSDLKIQMGCQIYCRLLYAKSLIMYKINEKENYLNYLEKSDSRTENLQKAEKDLRDILLIVSVNEELNSLRDLGTSTFYKNFSQDLISKKTDEIVAKNKITLDELNTFYLNKSIKKDIIDIRKERINLICEIRILIAKISYSQGFYLASCSILLKCLDNVKMYSKNYFLGIETCEDYPVDFKINQPQVIQKGKNIPQAESKKQAIPDKKGVLNTTSSTQPINLTEEINKAISTINSNCNSYSYSNPIYWLLINYIYLQNLFKMNRQEDCLGIIRRQVQQAQELNDFYFTIRFKEIGVMIYLSNYNIAEANKIMSEIAEASKINNLIDYEYALFLANYSEFLYAQNDSLGALTAIKTARRIMWLKMAKLNYEIRSQSYIEKKIASNLEIDRGLKNVLKEKEGLAISGPNVAVKKNIEQAAKKKDDRSETNQAIDYNASLQIDVEKGSKKIAEIFDKVNKDTNNSDEVDNLYFKHTDLLCRIDLRFVLYQLTNCSSNSNTGDTFIPNERIQFDSLISVLSDLEILSEKLLYPHNSFKIILFYLYGKLYKIKFINDLHDFLKEKMSLISKKENLEILTNREVLIKFSNYYNIRCDRVWTELLMKSREYYEKSVQLIKGEFFTFENGFNLGHLLQDLSEVNLLLVQFRPSLLPKYADVNEIVNKINSLINSNKYYEKNLAYTELEENIKISQTAEKSSWIDEKEKSEKLQIKNSLRFAIYYAELAYKVSSIKKLLNDNIFEIANGSLIDPNKLPRDIISQILETDYLYKKRNKQYLNQASVTIKSLCDSFDVLTLLKSLTREAEFFTFQNEEGMKNISKLNKYLKMNLTSYATKCCVDIVPAIYVNDLSSTADAAMVKKDQAAIYFLTNKSEIVSTCHPDVINEVFCSSANINSGNFTPLNLVYILGASSVENEYKDVVYGRIFGSKEEIAKLNRKFIEMKINLRNVLAYSEQKKKRDLKYFNKEYLDLAAEFCGFFLRVKKIYQESSFVMSSMRKDFLGEVSLDNLEFFINLTAINTYVMTNPKLNAFLYDLHLKLN